MAFEKNKSFELYLPKNRLEECFSVIQAVSNKVRIVAQIAIGLQLVENLLMQLREFLLNLFGRNRWALIEFACIF